MSTTMSFLVLAWVVIVLLCLAVGGLTAQIRELQSTVIGRPLTRQAPIGGHLQGHDGRRVVEPYIAVFTLDDCRHCEAVVSTVVSASTSINPILTIAIVGDEIHQDSSVDRASPLLEWIVDPTAATRFNIPAFPWLVAVNADGDIVDDGVIANPRDAISRMEAVSYGLNSETKGTLA